MEPILKTWYDALRKNSIKGLRCQHCGALQFPPVPVCNSCGSLDTEWVDISRKAQLITFSYSPMGIPPYTEEPVMGGFFQLQEGPYFMTWLVGAEGSDQKRIFDEMPFDVTAEAVKINDEHDLYFPVFRRA